MKKETYNVVQWSSGNVGKASIIGINNRKDLHLSGLIVSGKNEKFHQNRSEKCRYIDRNNRKHCKHRDFVCLLCFKLISFACAGH